MVWRGNSDRRLHISKQYHSYLVNTAHIPVLVGETPLHGSCIPLSLGEIYRTEITAYSGGDGIKCV